MTQPEMLLQILKNHAATGISAEEIQQIVWMPQYNSRILDIRRVYGFESVESRRCPDGVRRFFWREPAPAQIEMKIA
jgi:hypothetical protein